MTQEELLAREAIRHTLACYNMSGDRLQAENFIAVFTEDAILESEGASGQDGFRHAGRQAIRDWIGRWREPPGDNAPAVRRPRFVRHHLSTCLIEFADADTARVRTYWSVYTDIGPDHCGYYQDVFRKSGDRWLIAHRKVRLDWWSPDSLMVSGVRAG